jgi:hypothetical protein
MYGGKAAVFFDDFNRWFADLWHGKALAKVVAALSVFVSLGIYLFANSLAPDRKSDDQDAADRDKPG